MNPISTNKVTYFEYSYLKNQLKNSMRLWSKGCVCPSIELDQKEQDEIDETIKNWIEKMNFKNAMLHFEAKCRPKAWQQQNPGYHEGKYECLMPIEMNIRLAGAEKWSMIKTVYGVDLLSENLNIALGLELNESVLKEKLKNPKFKYISRYVQPARSALVEQVIIDVRKLQKNENAAEICVFKSPGEKLLRGNCVAWFAARADLNSTSEQLLSVIHGLMRHAKFVFKDF
jgi:hypothetical protein